MSGEMTRGVRNAGEQGRRRAVAPLRRRRRGRGGGAGGRRPAEARPLLPVWGVFKVPLCWSNRCSNRNEEALCFTCARAAARWRPKDMQDTIS
eukprot:1417397-Rhodomonas_salina.1